MSIFNAILLLVGGIFIGALIVYLSKKKSADSLMLLNQLNEIARKMDFSMGQTSDMSHKQMDIMQKQFGEGNKVYGDVRERLAKVEEAAREMLTSAENLQDLQDILKNPKQRGVLGEYFLETLLKNVLPGSYQMQYPFKDGTIVDAVVKVKGKIIPIDSKFSIENYNRLVEEKDPVERERLEKAFKQDLKNRIDETAKYVKQDEGTLDFAFMFIPHEAIYYDLLVAQIGAVKVNTRDLIEYAFKEKHVIIVSPTSFLAYLQTVLQGLKALQIEESVKEIVKNVAVLEKHLLSYEDYFSKVGKNLNLTFSAYTNASKEFKKIDKDIFRITGKSMNFEPALLDKPEESE